MLTRNKLLICNTSLYGSSVQRAYQSSISQQAWPPYHIPGGVRPLGLGTWKPALLSIRMPPGLTLFPVFSPPSKASYYLLSNSRVVMLWITIENKSNLSSLWLSLTLCTETAQIANLVLFGGMSSGQLCKEFFIWFMSKRCFVKFG